jgi:hypothetical protein
MQQTIQIERILSTLEQMEREYKASASLILHPSGSGAVRLDRHLATPPIFTAVDFDESEEIDQCLERLRQKAAQAF